MGYHPQQVVSKLSSFKIVGALSAFQSKEIEYSTRVGRGDLLRDFPLQVMVVGK